jgi:hypothetical protein
LMKYEMPFIYYVSSVNRRRYGTPKLNIRNFLKIVY